MNGCVVIPTFNESKIIYDLVLSIKKYGLAIIVVDDGSSDDTAVLARKAGAHVVVHERNQGKGASVRTGFGKSLEKNFDFTIIMDGDGQHHPDDIQPFIDAYKTGRYDLIIGNRMDNPENMPYLRWLTNKIMSMFISSACKQYLPDTQCGFRLIRNSVIKDMVISTSNYEIESEMLIQAAKKKYAIVSVPIRSIYEGQASQINPVVDTVRFFRFLLKDWLREGWTILKEFFNDVVVKHGSVLFLASVLCNIFNLAFWLFMIRRLDHVEYGILNSMVSFLAIISFPSLVLQTVLARYFAEFQAEEKRSHIQALFRAFFRRIAFLIGIFSSLIFVFSPQIAGFLRLDSSVFVRISVFGIVSSAFLVLTISTMQGIYLFQRMALNSIFFGFSKLVFGVVFVFGGLQALGGFLGFVVAELVTFVFSLFQLPSWIYQLSKRHYKEQKPFIRLKEIYGYFVPVSVALIAYTLFINIDVILVKHFFSESQAGLYSIAQTVGKILLYLSSSIALVFFPVTVRQAIQKRSSLPLLKKSLFFVGTLTAIVIIFTFSFPVFMLKLISGRALPACVPLVRYVIFPMGLFSIVYIFIFYNLSLGNKQFITRIFIIALLQIVLIFLFHQTLFDVIAILLLSSVLSLYCGIRSIEKEKGL